jgi:hypothetical protein
MKLLTNELKSKLPRLYATQDENDPTVFVKLFHPFSNWTWFLTEFDPDENISFGLVQGQEIELGYFSIAELEELRVNGLGVERDLHWVQRPLSSVRAMLEKGRV